MIAVAVAVIIGVVAVTCGIVADSNHPDSLTFLGVMVRTTAAQIFLAGAICTWALFAALWLLSAGIRRSHERGIELRALRAAASGIDFEAEENAAREAAAAAAFMAPNNHGYPVTGANGYPILDMNGYPIAHASGHPGGSADASWTADSAVPPAELPGHGPGPAAASGGRDSADPPDDGSPGAPMAFGSWETPPDWSAPHGLPTAPDDWAHHFAPPSADASAPRRTPTSPADWASRLALPPDDAAVIHRESSTPDYWASGRLADLDGEPIALGNLLGFNPLGPDSFAASPPFFDQFTSDSMQAAAEFAGSGHIASDPADTVPPRCGPVGPALADGTSPAAGLDGVDPRRARKPFGE